MKRWQSCLIRLMEFSNIWPNDKRVKGNQIIKRIRATTSGSFCLLFISFFYLTTIFFFLLFTRPEILYFKAFAGVLMYRASDIGWSTYGHLSITLWTFGYRFMDILDVSKKRHCAVCSRTLWCQFMDIDVWLYQKIDIQDSFYRHNSSDFTEKVLKSGRSAAILCQMYQKIDIRRSFCGHAV